MAISAAQSPAPLAKRMVAGAGSCGNCFPAMVDAAGGRLDIETDSGWLPEIGDPALTRRARSRILHRGPWKLIVDREDC